VLTERDVVAEVEAALAAHEDGACRCSSEPGLTVNCVIAALHLRPLAWLRALVARVKAAEAERGRTTADLCNSQRDVFQTSASYSNELDQVKAKLAEAEAALTAAEQWTGMHAQICADGETREPSQIEAAFREGWQAALMWRVRLTYNPELTIDEAWADYVHGQGGKL
jgi:hypothetical protein